MASLGQQSLNSRGLGATGPNNYFKNTTGNIGQPVTPTSPSTPLTITASSSAAPSNPGTPTMQRERPKTSVRLPSQAIQEFSTPVFGGTRKHKQRKHKSHKARKQRKSRKQRK